MSENMIDTIINRRSSRKYLDKDIDESIIKNIIDCGRCAPFGGMPIPKCQVTEYIVIKDKDIKEKHRETYECYTNLPNEILIEVDLTECRMWKSEEIDGKKEEIIKVIDLRNKSFKNIICDKIK